jgi:hypothetical protein|tara:strand:- start:836 stop:1114 length:279 start_codon:yes stop_codon:yes gene_type:complete
MHSSQFNIATLDEASDGAVPLFVLKKDSLQSAIDNAMKLIDPLDPRATKFEIMVQCKETMNQIKLATVYWDQNVSEVSAVTFPLNIEKTLFR